MSHSSKLEYVEIEDNPQFKYLRVKNIKGFIKMIQEFEIRFVFKTEKTNGESTESDFLFIKNDLMYRISANNFKTLEDYEDAAKADFPDAASYYDAAKAGLTTYKDYLDCKKTGVVDKSIYLKTQRLGFLDSYEKFKERCEKNKGLISPDFSLSLYDTPIKLCDFATSKGFKDYGDFDKAFFLGFLDKTTYDEAKLKGFTYADDYFNAVKMGFDLVKEYQEAKHLKIQNKYEYNSYIETKKLAKGIYSIDQVVLMNALKNAENGKKLSLKKLKELLNLNEEEFKFISLENGTRTFPGWYTRRLYTEDDIRAFLTQGNEIKLFGIFDKDGEYFEIWKISNQKIFMDASNVAFASKEGRSVGPKLANIKHVAEELNRLGITDISVIADASLRHRVVDQEMLTEVKKVTSYIEAPAKTSADEFLISSAKRDKCCIISNDTFKDWKMKDTWIAENIDRIRIPFIIDGDKVTFAGIEKLLSKS